MAEENLGGRPTKYEEAFDEQAYKLCLLGSTDKELADFFEVSEQTLNNWKKEHPSFFESLKDGKEKADAEVAKKLFKRATGYSHPDVHISNYQGDITVTDITKHYPPDTAAAIFWLNNRTRKRTNNWSNKHEITGADGEPIQFIIERTKKRVDAD